MCKTRFYSQGMILNDFKKHFWKNINDSQDPHPIKNFHIFFKTFA